MIPDNTTIYRLWNQYNLPERKRNHVALVRSVALYFAHELARGQGIIVDERLLEAAALLHDIDKNIPRLPGEVHPQTGVRILKQLGFNSVSSLVANHSVHAILYADTKPQTWEQKFLFLADKMVKDSVISVDERFHLWLSEDLPENEKEKLQQAYPLVKQLEQEVLELLKVTPLDVAKHIKLVAFEHETGTSFI